MRLVGLLGLAGVLFGCRRDVVTPCAEALKAQDRCFNEAYGGGADSGGSYSGGAYGACSIVDSIRTGRGLLIKTYECQIEVYNNADCSTPKGFDAAEEQALFGCL